MRDNFARPLGRYNDQIPANLRAIAAGGGRGEPLGTQITPNILMCLAILHAIITHVCCFCVTAAKAERQREQLAELRSQLSAALELPGGYWGRKWQFTDLHDVFISLKAHGKALPKGVTHEMEEQVDKLVSGVRV